jgi:ubiquinol-cytochrome c reductase iron-sulfur subunit
MSSTTSATPGHDADAPDSSRRTWLTLTCGAGAVMGVGAAAPFVLSFEPSERAKAAGAPVEVDISDLKPGEKKTVEWRGKPVWILRRDPAMLESLNQTEDKVADPKSERKAFPTPAYAMNQWRAREDRKDVLVAVGICTHLGCSPSDRLTPGPQASLPDDWPGGFLCPCHGSTFDLSGRVYKNKPAPDNLEIPPYTFLSESRIIIGEDSKA